MMRAAEFFAGIGLVRIALERCGWSVVFANDIDPKKAALYCANFGDADFRLGDIYDLSATDIPDVELATASFPCIDVSLAGNRRGLSGKHSSAYWGFHRLLSGMGPRRPRSLLLENVVGLLHSHSGSDLRKIISSLNALGYACELLQVDAGDFVPQSRPRLFIVGHLSKAAEGSYFSSPHPARTPGILEFKDNNSDLLWFSAWLPPLPNSTYNLLDVFEDIAPDSDLWWDLRRQKHLASQMSARHRALLRRAVAGRSTVAITVYKRVRPDGCRAELRQDGRAGCLRTPRGGSSKQFVIFAGSGQWRVRNMTSREYARLQGVSDSYVIPVPENMALLGFGDAICVPVVEWVLNSAVNPYAMEHIEEPIGSFAYAEANAI